VSCRRLVVCGFLARNMKVRNKDQEQEDDDGRRENGL